jgi:PPOX class probable F420-dependent enzyme
MVEIPDSHRDLPEAATMAVLGTNGPDGFPQLTALGFLYDNGVFKLCTLESSQKIKNLRRAPECSLFVFALESQHRYLEVRGTAELVADPDWRESSKISAKYGVSGDEQKQRDPAGVTRYVIAITPKTVVAWGAAPS